MATRSASLHPSVTHSSRSRSTAPAYNLRAIAATAISQVLDQGRSLSTVLPELQRNIGQQDHSLLQELCFGTLRVLPQLEWCVQQLMAKVMSGKQRILHYLLLVGLYQLLYTRIPAHAAVAETVNGAVALKRPQLKGVINGVMRQFQRQQQDLLSRCQNNPCHLMHPDWLLSHLQQAYPEQWLEIIAANNQKPPMWLRVNRRYHSRDTYQTLLQEAGITAFGVEDFPDALRLETPCPVNALPGFEKGWVTVQDLAAQGCIPLLDPQNGEQILDLCAAPGGKTTHILEIAPKSHVLAIDIDETRLPKIKENLRRLHQHAQVRQGDGCQPETWLNGDLCDTQLFDRILLDAPCSATGVIRRHPDIKWLRRESDIEELVALQARMLEAIWPYLKPGGVLLYATCSVLPQENSEQIRLFLQRHADAILTLTGTPTLPGWQRVPISDGGDGFFYAKLVKSKSITI